MIIYLGYHGNAGKHEKDLKRPLTDLGKEQAIYMRDIFSYIDFDIVFSCPARRSRETANIIAPYNGAVGIPELYPSNGGVKTLLNELQDATLRTYLTHILGVSVWNIGHDAYNHITDIMVEYGVDPVDNTNILIVSGAIPVSIVGCFFSPWREDKVCMDTLLREGEFLKIDTSNAVSEHISLSQVPIS